MSDRILRSEAESRAGDLVTSAALDALIFASDRAREEADKGHPSQALAFSLALRAAVAGPAAAHGWDPDLLHEYALAVVAARQEMARSSTVEDLVRVSEPLERMHPRFPGGGRFMGVPVPADDYVPGVTDLRLRALFGAENLATLVEKGGALLDRWLADLEAFRDAAGRHEHSRAEVREVLEAVVAAHGAAHAAPGALQAVDQAVRQLRLAEARYSGAPTHLEALEQQWRAYRLLSDMLPRAQDQVIRAGAPETLATLRTATAYSWAPMCVEAVASVGAGLPGGCTTSDAALGELCHGTGWWWFMEPVPVPTLSVPAASKPVVALAWRRATDQGGRRRTWFCCYVPRAVGGEVVPFPTSAWIWYDGVTLEDLSGTFRAEYRKYYPHGAPDPKWSAGEDLTVNAALWFSRFFLAGTMWLRTKYLALERGPGTRQVGRALQRAHRLEQPPTVEVVHLRRRDVLKREPVEPGASGRKYDRWRWVVHEFTRNQWYPSLGTHVPIPIPTHLKGPEGAPLKDATRVYGVDR